MGNSGHPIQGNRICSFCGQFFRSPTPDSGVEAKCDHPVARLSGITVVADGDIAIRHQDCSGSAHHSRHDPRQICYAMFEPAEPLFDAADPKPFATIMPRIRAILISYGKMFLTH